MSWTEITREQYRRDGLRYASDTTDAEWKLIEPLMPGEPAGVGRPRGTSDLRAVMNAILYVSVYWLPMAGAAEGVSGALDRARVLLPLAR